MKKDSLIIALLVIILMIVFVSCCAQMAHAVEIVEPEDNGEPIWTEDMIAIHRSAEILRSYGYSDDSEVIQALKQAWEQADKDLHLVARVIKGECGQCSYEQQVYTGVCIVNRSKAPIFHADTIEKVIAAPGQYTTLYLTGLNDIPRQNLYAARDAIDGKHDAPEDLWWQANFPQGKETWKVIRFKSPYFASTTYFCRGSIYAN